MTHRFINADKYASTGNGILGHNMFAYCMNNPVNYVDYYGTACICLTKRVRPGHVCNDNSKEYVLGSGQSSHDSNRRPNSGEPGSTWEAPNGDKRTFGPDGKPQQDYDHDDHGYPDKHPHDENGGHYHDWDWSLPKPRLEPHIFDVEPILEEGLTFTTILMALCAFCVVCV